MRRQQSVQNYIHEQKKKEKLKELKASIILCVFALMITIFTLVSASILAFDDLSIVTDGINMIFEILGGCK